MSPTRGHRSAPSTNLTVAPGGQRATVLLSVRIYLEVQWSRQGVNEVYALPKCKVELFADRPTGAVRVGEPVYTRNNGYADFPVAGLPPEDVGRLFVVYSLVALDDAVRVSFSRATQGPDTWSVRYPETGYISPSRQPIHIRAPHIPGRGVRLDGVPQEAFVDLAAFVYATCMRGKLWYDRASNGSLPALAPVDVVYPARDSLYQRKTIGMRVARLEIGTANGFDPEVILHEYGHHVFQCALPSYEAPGGVHTMCGSPGPVSMQQLALNFAEGYATFFGQNVLENPNYRDTNPDNRIDANVEYRSLAPSVGARAADVMGCASTGDLATAAYLWDLTDPATGEAGDTLQFTFRDVHAIMIESASGVLRDRSARMVLELLHRQLGLARPESRAALDALATRNGFTFM